MKDISALVLKLINDFSLTINKRSAFFAVYNALPKILEWHIKIWRKEVASLNDKTDPAGETWINYYEAMGHLNSSIENIQKNIFSENSPNVNGFFKNLEKHVDMYENEKYPIGTNEKIYVRDIFSILYKFLLPKSGHSPMEDEVWEHYFPPEWKITEKTIRSDHLAAKMSFEHFLQWAIDRIRERKEEKFNSEFSDVVSGLFPDIDPATWTCALLFIFSPFDSYAARVKYIIQKPWIHARHRMHTLSGSIKEGEEWMDRAENEISSAIDNEKKKTYEFITYLAEHYQIFNQNFSQENLDKYIAETNSLEFQIESQYEYRRREILELFIGLKNIRKN